MYVVYVIGPYRAPTSFEMHHNIQAARDAAIQLWREGYAVICPHMNSCWLDGVITDTAFLKHYLHILARCDMAFVLPGWQHSVGSREEVKLCIAQNIPVFDITRYDIRLSPDTLLQRMSGDD